MTRLTVNGSSRRSEEIRTQERHLGLARLSKLPIERIQYFPESDTSLIDGVERGVLFIIAWWSGPAVQAFSLLGEVLGRLDPEGTLEFLVIDTDGARPFYFHPAFKGTLHGSGETAWIQGGVIQRTSGLGYNPDCFESNTKRLLDAV